MRYNNIKYQSFVYGSFVWGIHERYNNYRLLYGRGVPLGHIDTGVAISARGL